MYEADLPPFLPAHSLEETEAAEQRAKQRDADAFRSWRNLFDVIQAEFDFPGLTCTPEFPQTSYHHAVRGDAQVWLDPAGREVTVRDVEYRISWLEAGVERDLVTADGICFRVPSPGGICSTSLQVLSHLREFHGDRMRSGARELYVADRSERELRLNETQDKLKRVLTILTSTTQGLKYLNSVCTNFDFKEPLMALLECEELLRFELDHRLKVVAGLEVTEQRQYLMGPDAEEELRAQAETALRLEQAVKFWLGASIEAGVSSTPTGYPPEFFRVQN